MEIASFVNLSVFKLDCAKDATNVVDACGSARGVLGNLHRSSPDAAEENFWTPRRKNRTTQLDCKHAKS